MNGTKFWKKSNLDPPQPPKYKNRPGRPPKNKKKKKEKIQVAIGCLEKVES